VVGDRPADIAAQLRFMAGEGLDVVITTGGLGPTADDLTADVVAEFAGRPMRLDPELEARIGEILAPLRRRWRELDEDAVWRANRKQAMVPEGAAVLGPVGTAPGLVVPPGPSRPPSWPTVVVLPGPPRELQAMWPMALATPELQAALAGAERYERGILRLFGLPESEIAATLRAIEAEGGVDLSALEITTCLRRGEIEVATRYRPEAAQAYERFAAAVAARHGRALFSRDGSTIDEQVAALLLEGRLTVAVAESCTGGLLAGRLTARPGSSAYVLGGVVAYANEAKVRLAGVDPSLIAEQGAVSPEVALALAEGARGAFGAELGIGVTGVAGPGGGTPEKPVGYVCLCVAGPDDARLARALQLPGDREAIRDRSVTAALHLLRRLLRGERDGAGAAAAAPREREAFEA
jgi:nicotinamide-nucleotide amidase